MKQDDKKQLPNLSISQTQFYSGPLPPPEFLEKYEAICPGFAERILKMAEKEQQERFEKDKKLLDHEIEMDKEDIKIQKQGYWFALIGIVLIVGLCSYGFYLGFPNQSAYIAISIIVSLVGTFLVRTKMLEKEKKLEKSTNRDKNL